MSILRYYDVTHDEMRTCTLSRGEISFRLFKRSVGIGFAWDGDRDIALDFRIRLRSSIQFSGGCRLYSLWVPIQIWHKKFIFSIWKSGKMI